MREVAARHDACDGDTRIRLPRELPDHAVRRVVCSRCSEPYEATSLAESSPEHPATRPKRRLSPGWRWLGLPVAAVAVFAGLSALRGDDASVPAPTPPSSSTAPASDPPVAPKPTPVPGNARLVSGSNFSLALPSDWERTTPPGGATFTATSPDGRADATLWVERDPSLDFATFEANSLAQLESVVGSAEVVERNPGPSPEASSIKIAPTAAPPGAPSYEVILRSAGSNWYYLATTLQPQAGAADTRNVKLIQGSFLPREAKG